MGYKIKTAANGIITLGLATAFVTANAQTPATDQRPVQNWQLMDLKADGIFGISMEKAYAELLKGKKAGTVIVAVIDGGVDAEHEDLKANIWTNLKEKAGNKKDDDKNGYADDVHGWNFMGSSKGSFHLDNIELVRALRAELKKDPNSDQAKALQKQLDDKRKPVGDYIKVLEEQQATIAAIIHSIDKENPSIEDFKAYRYQNEAEAKVLIQVVKGLKENPAYLKNFEENYIRYKNDYDYKDNIDYDPRENNEFSKPFYGNPDSKGLEPSHGTHAAGIIAAVRDNGVGMNGVADRVMIMPLRAIPDGDALDKDIAGAIKYAADNGAKVINMSYGKAESPDRKLVDEAVKYAMEKDVLIVHSAGNSGMEQAVEAGYPSRHYLDGGIVAGWIEVGASGPKDNKDLQAWFSNYGAKTVDVFAPGLNIYSTYPDNKYAYESGTSMAAPVVSGLVAMLRAYYPKLTAVQIKEIIMKSVIKKDQLKGKCISSGVVNAYEAFKLAQDYKVI